MLFRGSQLVQLPWPGLHGVWQLAGNFSLSLLAHGVEVGKQEKGVRVTEQEKEGGNGGHLELQGCS